MKPLSVLLVLIAVAAPTVSKVASIQNIRHRSLHSANDPPRKLKSTSLATDMKISSKQNDLFSQYVRYSLKLKKDENDSKKLTKLTHKLLMSVEEFSLLLNDHLSNISNQMNRQRLDFFIHNNPYGSGLD